VEDFLMVTNPTYEELKKTVKELEKEVIECRRAEQEAVTEQDKYRSTIENAVSGVFQTTPEGRYLYANQSMAKILGYEGQEELITNISDIGNQLYVRPTDRDKLLGKLIKEGKIFNFETQVYRKDKTIIWLSLSERAVKDRKGKILFIEGFAEDVTERIRVEDALRASEEKFRSILESIEDGYYEVDIAGNLTFFNESMCRMLGYSKAELMGMNNRQYMDEENANKVYHTFNKVYSTGKATKAFDWELIRKEGAKCYVETSVSLIKDLKGQPIGFRGIARDITERKRAEQALKEAHDQLENRVRERTAELAEMNKALRKENAERQAAEEALRQSEEKYRNILESIEEGYYEVDVAGKLSFFNDSICKIFGYPKSELIGRHLREFTDPQTAKAGYEAFNRVYKTGFPIRDFSWEIIRKDGTKRYVEASASLMRDVKGQKIGFQGVIRDVTERKRAETALRKSEEQFRKLVEESPLGVVLIRPDGRYEYVNRSFVDMFGYDLEEVSSGWQWFQRAFPDPEIREEIIETWKFDLEEIGFGRSIPRTFEVVCKDGSKKTVLFRPVALPEGHQLVILEDITELKRAEEVLKRQNAYLSALHETTMGLIKRLDLNDLLKALISRAAQLLGASDAVIYLVQPETNDLELKLGTGNFTQRIGTRLERGEGLCGKVWQTGRPLIIDDYSKWSGLSKKFRDNNIGATMGVPLKSGKEVVGVFAINLGRQSDRTFGKEEIELLNRFAGMASIALDNALMYKATEEAKEAAEAASRTKSAFLASMSHELRTPLNAIIGYSEMLMEDAEELEQEQFVSDLKRIHASGKHLLMLINDVLDISKIEAGKMELFLETFDIPRMIQDVVSTIQPLADKNSNLLKVYCPDSVGAMHADLAKVRQALFNLLSNACKFTEEGTIWLEVSPETEDGKRWLKFKVRDTGIGMTEDQMENLFQVFSQAHTPMGGDYGGTGLGLAITKRYCRMMGGDVTAESGYGGGSTFTIRLPAETRIPGVAERVPTEARVQPVSQEIGTILVIDDEPAVRDLMKRFLGKEGFRVETASGGKDGLKLARELRPHAITLDVMMPKMDGWSVLSALKADPELADIPVIMFTVVDDKNLGYSLGASDYLTKPIDRERLVSVIRQHTKAPAPGRVLLVEDDANMRDLLRRMLEKEGWAVAEAKNGRVALERIAEEEPALILLDLMMPEMDGFELVAELRKHKAWHSIPIVVLTAKNITSEDRLRLNGKVKKILQKESYTREELLDDVRDLLQGCIRQRNSEYDIRS
jgi:PAS domain S-box-containing protein